MVMVRVVNGLYLATVATTATNSEYEKTSYELRGCPEGPAHSLQSDKLARQNGMCAQQRLRSAWASAQSDQSSLFA